MSNPPVQRLALVIGLQCLEVGDLKCIRPASSGLYRSLTRDGVWSSARRTDAPLLNPTIAKLNTEINAAFIRADRERATLLLAFIGHGTSTGQHDFRLFAKDSPAHALDSHNSFHLTQTLRERLELSPSLDGLIVLVDACEAGQGVAGAAQRWPDVLATSGRIEVLAASGAGDAYGACFSRTITRIIDTGLPGRGSSLLCAEIRPDIARLCPWQQPEHLSYSRGAVSPTVDPGLWLMPNRAYAGGAAHTLSHSGLLDYLTRPTIATASVYSTLADIIDAGHLRLQLVTGTPGCGKSTLLAILVRPATLDTLPINNNYITAAVFCDSGSTLDSLTHQLAEQLCDRVDGFRQTRERFLERRTEWDKSTKTSFRLEIIDVLRGLPSKAHRVRILIDGLDQLATAAADTIMDGIEEIVGDTTGDLDQVRIVCGAREETPVARRLRAMAHVQTTVRPPNAGELAEAMRAHKITTKQITAILNEEPTGGWLLVRLLAEVDRPKGRMAFTLEDLVVRRVHQAADHADDSSNTHAVLAVLVAAGVGTTLPLAVLGRALAFTGESLHPAELRDIVVGLGVLICRDRPGEDTELLGIAHTLFLDPLTVLLDEFDDTVHRAHIGIVDAIESPTTEYDSQVEAYRDRVGPLHHLGCRRYADALDILVAQDGPNAADNRDRWASYLPEFLALSPQEESRLAAEEHHAQWVGRSGDVTSARRLFSSLVVRRATGGAKDGPASLRTRRALAYWTGKSGDVKGAQRDTAQLVATHVHQYGPEHRDTLYVRHEANRWLGETGAVEEALTDAEELLTVQRKVLGAECPDALATLGTAYLVARWRRECGDHHGALDDFTALLKTRTHVLGQHHPETLNVRSDLARTQRMMGDHQSALDALVGLLDDRVRVLGPSHPDTLITRSDHALLTALTGDVDAGVAEFEALLDDQLRILGDEHPDTRRTRALLAEWANQP